MIENLLRRCGLHPMPINISGHVFVASGDQWRDLMIPEEEAKTARKIIVDIGYKNALVKRQQRPDADQGVDES